jgi:hypothetical protein
MHDLSSYLEIGARRFAADQLIVLRLFLACCPGGCRLKPPATSPKEKAINITTTNGEWFGTSVAHGLPAEEALRIEQAEKSGDEADRER